MSNFKKVFSIFSKNKRGFTLLELLLVISIIAILASIIIVALNPGKQVGDARNNSLRSGVNAIISAVAQYTLDNNGALPNATLGIGSGSIPQATDASGAMEICLTDPTDLTGATSLSCTDQKGGYVILTDLTKNGLYLPAIPAAPLMAAANTGIAEDAIGFAPCFNIATNPPTANNNLGSHTAPGPDSNDYLPPPTPSVTTRHGSGFFIYQNSTTHRITVYAGCPEQTRWDANALTGAIEISETH